MKVAVVGGGSTYTPELVSGLTRLDVSELALQDIDPERRDVVGGLARRMLDRQGYRGQLEITDDLDAAVSGADFVLIQIRVGVQPSRLLVDQVGLNHLAGVRRALLDGDDVLPRLLAEHGDEMAAALELPHRLLDELGAVPSYYLRYFYAHDEVLREQLGGVPRAQVVAEIERELLELYRDPRLVEKPALLEQRGGAFYSEAALGLVSSLVSSDGAVHEVDVRNDGTLVAHVRGPLSSPHHLGLDGCVDVLQELVDRAGLNGRQAQVGQVLLAGIDFPEEEERLYSALAERGWAAQLRIGNDTFAVLRA